MALLVTSDPTLGSAFDWENFFGDFLKGIFSETYRISSGSNLIIDLLRAL